MIADVQVVDDQLVELAPLLERSGVRVHVDHCGRPDPGAGLDAAGFRELLRWGATGRAVVKLSGCVKVSQRALPPPRTCCPTCALWSTRSGRTGACGVRTGRSCACPSASTTARCLTLLAEQVPDADARRRILWDTPVREFGLGGGSAQVAEGQREHEPGAAPG